MNPAVALLNQALAARPQVLSLHAPHGQTCVVFASHLPLHIAQVLDGWNEYLASGYVAIYWSHGIPTVTFAR